MGPPNRPSGWKVDLLDLDKEFYVLFGRSKGLKKGALIGIPSFKFSYARGSKRLPECAAMGNTNQKHIRLD